MLSYFMLYRNPILQIIVLSLNLSVCDITHATVTTKKMQLDNDVEIQHVYQKAGQVLQQALPSRIDFFSGLFLGKPYLLGALGEGETGFFDQYPLFRTDAFDCETYVDTVLALAFASDINTFKKYIRSIRYHNGHVSFTERNHFTCLDWNKNNQSQGYTKDITNSFKDINHHPVALTAQAFINKPSWYQHFSIQKIRIENHSLEEKTRRLCLLKHKGSQLEKTVSTIPYIPLSALFDKNGNANIALFNQIPNGSIIEIVRPNWNLSREIGTHLNVSHLGFAIRKGDTLLFRETSSKDGRAIDISLIDYLRQTLKSPTIEGINVQVAIDPNHSHHLYPPT